MKCRVIKSLFAFALAGSASTLTLLTATAPAHAWTTPSWLRNLDPTDKNSAVRQGIRKLDVTDQNSAIRQAGRYIDLSNKNSGLSRSTVGRFVNRVGRAVDPFNPQRNGGMWQKLDITDPNQPISQFCDPIAKYGAGAATTYFSGSLEAGMMAGGAASSALCGGGSNYGASRNASMGLYQQDQAGGYADTEAGSFEEFKRQQDYFNQQQQAEWNRQRAVIEAENQRERDHQLRMSNFQRASQGSRLGSLMEMQRRPLRLPSF